MDVWEVPPASRSGLDRSLLMDVGPTRLTFRSVLRVVRSRGLRQPTFESRVPVTRLPEGGGVVDELPLLTLLVRHREQPAHHRGAVFVARLAAAALLVRSPGLDHLGDDFEEKLHAGGPGELRIFELRQDLSRGSLSSAGNRLDLDVVRRRRVE